MAGVSTETVPPPPVDDHAPPPATDLREPRRMRPLAVAAAVLVLLLIGAAGGFLVGNTTSATAPAADSVDVEFAQDMIAHHNQAVEMAAWERDHTTDSALYQLAFDIESTQTAQVGRMQGWLELWGAAGQPVGRQYMTWMAGDPSMSGMSGGVATMPGMASATDLKNLRAATGKQLDVLFLQLMLRHHEGGSSMLSYAAQHASQPQVRNFAEQVLSSQTTEADYMKQLLTARGGTPLPI